MKLARREQMMVAAGLVVGSLLLGSELVVRPLWERRQALRQRVERAERELQRMRALRERHRRYREMLVELDRRLIRQGDRFSLFSFLEEAAGRAGIRERLVSMKPSEAPLGPGYRRMAMEVRFEDVALGQLVRYLEELAGAPKLIRVGRLRVERSNRVPGRVRVTAKVVAFAVRGTEGEARGRGRAPGGAPGGRP
ncbi:MAG: type II secretion system protein GspM [Nitrospinota bacterium]